MIIVTKIGAAAFKYLYKEEADKIAPLPRGSHHQDRGGFSFGGHRLFSLFRAFEYGALRLIYGKPIPVSSLQKYFNSQRGTRR